MFHITSSDDNLKCTQIPHDEYEVGRLFVDNGSSAIVLSLDVIKKIGGHQEQLRLHEGPFLWIIC